jgi:phosphoribosylanthranilate isomerase
MTLAKICGLQSRDDLQGALAAGADAVGFVVEVDGSRRSIRAHKARELISMVPPFTVTVAVIAPKDMDDAVYLAETTRANVLQIHDTLGARELGALREEVPQKLIAAVSTCSSHVPQMAGVAHALLLDTMKDGHLGGTGEVHDWDKSAALARELDIPVILAGGLCPSNVAKAISIVRPYAVDVSSGVEVEGKKDPQRMAEFVREVRMCTPS